MEVSSMKFNVYLKITFYFPALYWKIKPTVSNNPRSEYKIVKPPCLGMGLWCLAQILYVLYYILVKNTTGTACGFTLKACAVKVCDEKKIKLLAFYTPVSICQM